jgi:lipopolysaccharide/colanic/teichoic acid biosynthesis glycosyltransferase
MIRVFDIIISILGILILCPILFLLIILGYLDTGSPIFLQKRMGKDQKPFFLIKYRSMNRNTPTVPTHMSSKSSITRFGSFIRKSKLDELLQLFNVLIGDMSLVGPRPNLFSQSELIEERQRRKVYSVLPGITGLAQINKIDMSTPSLLAEIDAKMISRFNLVLYFKYIFKTLLGKGFGDVLRK